MGTLFEKLRRRKVFRVAAVYAVAAWVLIQVADTVLPVLQMPEWTVSFVNILLILGFPIAVILAWANEVSPRGIQIKNLCGVFAGFAIWAVSSSGFATTIEYDLGSGWVYETGLGSTLQVTDNPVRGVDISIDVPIGVEEGGLVASRHLLPDFTFGVDGFIELRWADYFSNVVGVNGASIALELEFLDVNNIRHELGVAIVPEGFGSWLQNDSGSLELDVFQAFPEALSILDGALGFIWSGDTIDVYFKYPDNSILYLTSWNMGLFTGAHNFQLDNDFGANTEDAGSVQASVNFIEVVYENEADTVQDTLPALTTVSSTGNPTDAIISGSVISDSDGTLAETVTVGETISVNISITPDSSHVGQDLEVIVAILVVATGDIVLLTNSGLIPYAAGDALLTFTSISNSSASNNFSIISGFTATEAEIGNYNIFVGYFVTGGDGSLFYNSDPIALIIAN